MSEELAENLDSGGGEQRSDAASERAEEKAELGDLPFADFEAILEDSDDPRHDAAVELSRELTQPILDSYDRLVSSVISGALDGILKQANAPVQRMMDGVKALGLQTDFASKIGKQAAEAARLAGPSVDFAKLTGADRIGASALNNLTPGLDASTISALSQVSGITDSRKNLGPAIDPSIYAFGGASVLGDIHNSLAERSRLTGGIPRQLMEPAEIPLPEIATPARDDTVRELADRISAQAEEGTRSLTVLENISRSLENLDRQAASSAAREKAAAKVEAKRHKGNVYLMAWTLAVGALSLTGVIATLIVTIIIS